MTKKLETILEDALAIADEVLAQATVISESEQTQTDDIELNEDENLSEMDLANVTPVATPAPAGNTVDESAKKKKKKSNKVLTVPSENVKPEGESELDVQKGDEANVTETSIEDIIGESTDEEESTNDSTNDPSEEDDSIDALVSEWEQEQTSVEDEDEDEESIDDLIAEWEPGELESLANESTISEDASEDESNDTSSSSESDSETEVSESSKSKKKDKILCEKCNKNTVSESGKVCESCGPKGSKKSKALNEEDEDTSEDEGINESIDDLVADMVQLEEKGEIDTLVEELLEAAESGTWISGNDFEELDDVFKKQGTANTGDRASKSVIKIHPDNNALTGEEPPIVGDPLEGDPSSGDGDLNNDGKIDLIRS